MKAKLILLAFLISSFSSCHAIIKVANVNGSPVSNPKLSFGSYSDSSFYYFFESDKERKDFIAALNVGVPTPEQIDSQEAALILQFKQILQSCVGVRGDQLTATQVRALALFAADRHLGCIDRTNFKIKPLNTWVRQ